MSALAILTALAVAYFVITTISMVWVQPMRVRLAILVDEMLEEDHWLPAERATLTFVSTSTFSSSIGLLAPFAAIFAVAVAVLKGKPSADMRSAELPNLNDDPRVKDLAKLQGMIIAGNSPFATVVTMAISAVGYAVLLVRGDKTPWRAFATPLRRASEALQA